MAPTRILAQLQTKSEKGHFPGSWFMRKARKSHASVPSAGRSRIDGVGGDLHDDPWNNRGCSSGPAIAWSDHDQTLVIETNSLTGPLALTPRNRFEVDGGVEKEDRDVVTAESP